MGVCKVARHLGHMRADVWESILVTLSGFWVCSHFLFESEKEGITPECGDSPCPPNTGLVPFLVSPLLPESNTVGGTASLSPAYSQLEWTLCTHYNPTQGRPYIRGPESTATALRLPNSTVSSPDY